MITFLSLHKDNRSCRADSKYLGENEGVNLLIAVNTFLTSGVAVQAGKSCLVYSPDMNRTLKRELDSALACYLKSKGMLVGKVE
jgi:hypothetical protein